MRKKIIVLGLVIGLFTFGLIHFYGPMAPIQEGTSASFWSYACGVTPDGHPSHEGWNFYLPRDGWYIYYDQGFHGQFLYRVKRDRAIEDYNKILSAINRLDITKDSPQALVRAKRVLSDHRSAVSNDPDRFLYLIYPERYVYEEEQGFSERWSRIQRYWLNFVFEFSYFTFLAVFAFWPWLKRKPVWSWCLHGGLLPLLIMWPYYLGYATWTFTSAGPSGGVLYPWIITSLRIPLWTGVDSVFFRLIPKFLEPLSQSPGPMMSVTGGDTLGPVSALLIGVGIALVILAVYYLVRWMRWEVKSSETPANQQMP